MGIPAICDLSCPTPVPQPCQQLSSSLHPVSPKLLMPLKCLLFDIPETLFIFFPLYLCPYLWTIFACFPKLDSDITFSDGLSERPQTFPPPLVLYSIGR